MHPIISISEIPKDDKIFNLEEAINLDASRLQTETTGEKIVKQIQEWLLTKVNSSETAVLPEDKMQRLLVGVSFNSLCPFPILIPVWASEYLLTIFPSF